MNDEMEAFSRERGGYSEDQALRDTRIPSSGRSVNGDIRLQFWWEESDLRNFAEYAVVECIPIEF
jgi:hypothetical protein